MSDTELIRRGRDACARQQWRDAVDALDAADRETPLAADDLERLACAAYLTGDDPLAVDSWMRAHQEHLHSGETRLAVRCAFWLSFVLMNRGEQARAGGWVARAQRLLDDTSIDCAEQGYLLIPVGFRHIMKGERDAAWQAFSRAADLATRFAEPDLMALTLHCRGRVLLRSGRIDEGVALLDEAMAAVDAGDVSPIVTGDVYCSVIEGCMEVFDLRRAQEWTMVLSDWCASQPDLVPFRGQCMVRRSEILQLHGEWAEAMTEAQRAGEWLTRPPGEPAAGLAFYQKAELHRLRGEFAQAEEAYQLAATWGMQPQPGLALLRLAQGRASDAAAALRRALTDARERRKRAQLLPAIVDVLLAVNDVSSAGEGADELQRIAEDDSAPLVEATAARARGAVLLAQDDPTDALPLLRRACELWSAVGAPFEVARTRTLLGTACRAAGDADGARMEFDAARRVFERLGAAPELRRLELTSSPVQHGDGLTDRQREVLRLIARGHTNRDIAAELRISEKTVARHISNIFLRLGVSSRAAATAYAYEQQIVRRDSAHA